jgi:hypothetical protein
MHKAMKRVFAPKKVTLQDVASPHPSRNAGRVLKSAIKQAYIDQETVSRKAAAIRSH